MIIFSKEKLCADIFIRWAKRNGYIVSTADGHLVSVGERVYSRLLPGIPEWYKKGLHTLIGV